jgi:hypothetical protein
MCQYDTNVLMWSPVRWENTDFFRQKYTGCISRCNGLFIFHDLETLVYRTQSAYKRRFQNSGQELTSKFPQGTPNEIRKISEALFKVRQSEYQPITCNEGTEWEQRCSSALSFNSELHGWTAPRPACFNPGRRPGWVGPRYGTDECGKSRLHLDSTPDPPARSESLYRLSYSGPY